MSNQLISTQLPLVKKYVEPSVLAGLYGGAAFGAVVGAVGGITAGAVAGASFGLNMMILWPLVIRHCEEVSKMRGGSQPHLLHLLTPTPWAGTIAMLCAFSLLMLNPAVMPEFPMKLAVSVVMTSIFAVLVGPLAVARITVRAPRAEEQETVFTTLDAVNNAVDQLLAQGNYSEADKLSLRLLQEAESQNA